MHDFVQRLIKRNPDAYAKDGIHEYNSAKMFIKFLVHGNGAAFDILEFKRFWTSF